jgi:hypothetical protein
MEQDDFETLVVFRKYKRKHKSKCCQETGGIEILALFPDIIEKPNGACSCYQHVGQHGSADYNYCIDELTIPAKPEEYKDLKEELESLGYKLKIRKKWMNKRW